MTTWERGNPWLHGLPRRFAPRSAEGVAVSESLSSVSDTIFNLDIIHRTDMQGNISARQQAEDKLKLYASVFRHAREGIMIISAVPDPQGIVRTRWHASVWCCLYL